MDARARVRACVCVLRQRERERERERFYFYILSRPLLSIMSDVYIVYLTVTLRGSSLHSLEMR